MSTTPPVPATEVRLRVSDMDCASCLARIQDHLSKVDGVLAVEGSPVARSLQVQVNPSKVGARDLTGEVGKLGYSATPDTSGEARPPAPTIWRSRQAAIALASAGLFALALILRFAAGPWPVLVAPAGREATLPDLLLLVSALVGGWNFFPKGLRAARDLALDMNFLMTVAIVGAVLLGELTEAAAIAFLFALAELLEGYSVERARRSVESLMELAPATARVLRGGAEVVVDAAELVPGDQVVVRPGERVPADGRVVEGHAAVDQSAVTGESLPVEKEAGDEVFSGTIDRDGFMRVEVTRAAADSTLARIVRLVEEAQKRRSRTERFVDRFARRYTPIVTALAVAMAALPPLLLGAPLETWLVRGLTLLVIACPCALVISTPVAVVSGLTGAARNGVLVKGGEFLEALGEVQVVALDKTGTLTTGHLEVVEVRVAGGAGSEEEKEDVLRRAAAVEARSEHPVARAIVEAVGGSADLPGPVTAFRAVPGRGATATLGGVDMVIGRPDLVAEAAPGAAPPPDDLTGAGRTVVGVAAAGELLAWIAMADRPRSDASVAVAALRRAGPSHVVMLTGDDPTTARRVAADLGITEVRAGLLPEGKVEAVREMEATLGPVAMVGDGVNDAPALAAARVGIAMGAAGSDVALETADVALMGDDLARLAWAVRLSHRARRVIRQNVAVALGVKALLVVGVPLGLVSLITAVVVGDMGVSLAVTLNALRLGRREAA